MIYSKLDKLQNYLDDDIYEKVKIFLDQVSEDMPEGKYEIWDDKVYARVMSYSTSLPDVCKIEAHDKYIDIQATITGAEGISVYERKCLVENTAYDFDNDVAFFETKGANVIANTVNLPGYFTMLLPEDAHRPQERVCGMDRVKKFVIKVAVGI